MCWTRQRTEWRSTEGPAITSLNNETGLEGFFEDCTGSGIFEVTQRQSNACSELLRGLSKELMICKYCKHSPLTYLRIVHFNEW